MIVQCELLLTSIFHFLLSQKNILSMAAILNFSKTLKKSLADLRNDHGECDLNNFRLYKFWSFCAHKKLTSGGHFEFW